MECMEFTTLDFLLYNLQASQKMITEIKSSESEKTEKK